MLYTRNGDSGTSGLFGTKKRFGKDSAVYEALGAVDELNSFLGMVRAISKKEYLRLIPWLPIEIQNVQEKLFIIQAELAGSDKQLSFDDTTHLEKVIQHCENTIENPNGFIISGETMLSSLLDYARAVSRRTERAVLRVKNSRKVSKCTLIYLNRLSSFLYALARFASQVDGAEEKSPTYITK